jgi:hypothetical protein
MQGNRLLLEEEYPLYLRQETDTHHPRTPIPIFYIHDLPTPFCTNPLCFCQRSKQDAAKLLGGSGEGTFLLLTTATLVESKEAMSDTTSTTQQTCTVIHVALTPDVPEECQLHGHSWEKTENPDVKACEQCHTRGYCPGFTPQAPQNAQPFSCTAHTRKQVD